MRLTKSIAFAVSALALGTGAAFGGGDPMSSHEQQEFMSSMSPQEQQEFLSYGRSEAPLSDQSDPLGYQPNSYQSYEQGGPRAEYEVYDVYIVPAEEIVLIPLEEPSEGPVSGS